MQSRKRFHDGLDEDLKRALLVQVRNLWTHTSTAIEGNTLTLGETDFILSEGLTVAGKPLKDHREVVGHARAIDLIYQLLDRIALVEQDVFDLHKSIMTEVVVDVLSPVGGWKREPNSTNAVSPDAGQVVIEFPAPERMPELMQRWLGQFNALSPESMDDAVHAYAVAHLEFVSIHPFYDGNGRLARLLANLPVLRAGFPPLVVPKERRLDYLRAIAAYQLSIPGYPAVTQFPANAERAAFISLCAEFAGETRRYVEDVRRLQAARQGG